MGHFEIPSPPAAKAANDFGAVTARLKRLRKKCRSRCGLTSAAKATVEIKPLIAAVNRCATQNRAH